MKTSDFSYDLPEHLIAQHPLEDRSESRLLVLDGRTGAIRHDWFRRFPDLLEPGDCLVLNDTRVLPARLTGTREGSGGRVEFLLLRRLDQDRFDVLVRPGRRLKEGDRVAFLPGTPGEGGLSAQILERTATGGRIVRFEYSGIWETVLDRAGTIPLPPYIRAPLADPERYQTVYARENGSAAAPTAGLHFTPEVLDRIRDRGIRTAFLTLHVGLGTFRPVQAESVDDHRMHEESFVLPADVADAVAETRRRHGRVVAVGTTTCRVLETMALPDGTVQPGAGTTRLFLRPGSRFQCVDALLTNFHLPRSTLLMLVSAFAGRDAVLGAYREAIAREYRFFSFGDAMFLSSRREPGHDAGT